MCVVKSWVSNFFIVIFGFPILKLVSVPIFSLIGPVFNFEGWGEGVVVVGGTVDFRVFCDVIID